MNPAGKQAALEGEIANLLKGYLSDVKEWCDQPDADGDKLVRILLGAFLVADESDGTLSFVSELSIEIMKKMIELGPERGPRLQERFAGLIGQAERLLEAFDV